MDPARSDADVAAVTRVLANRARLAMLERLMDGLAHPAGDLAREAGIAPSTASGHLAELVEAGLVHAEPSGRQRRYRLSSPEVARAIEALAVIAPRRRVSSLRAATAAERLREGRTCYDHLAGRLGVAVTDALLARRALRRRDGAFDLTGSGEQLFRSIDIDVGAGGGRRRAFALACQDWTERRSHLAGALGAELCDRLFELGWVARRRPGRAVALTEAGGAGLRKLLRLEFEPASSR
jgi:DNA-binding transcriptional ArsR family regulator